MNAESACVLVLLVLGYALVSGRIGRGPFSPALIFMVCGVVLGPFVIGAVDVDGDRATFKIIADLALTVILFNQAARLDLHELLRRRALPRRLLAIGIPVSVALGALTAVLLLPAFSFWEAVCVAVVVAPTEVALVEALLEDHRIPERIRDALSVESGLYDGFALAGLLVAMSIAAGLTDPVPGHWLGFAFRTVVLSALAGAVIGLVGSKLSSLSSEHRWIGETWAQLATLALAILSFGVGEWFHGSGFVTAFAAGMTFVGASRKGESAPAPTQVSQAAGQLLELVVFALFGATAVVPAWQHADWRVVTFAVVALIVVRLVAVAVALSGSGVPTTSRLFVGWFGPRGIGTLVLGMIVIDTGAIQHVTVITQVAVVTVTLSLVLHSVTAKTGIRLHDRYTRTNDDHSRATREEHRRTAT